MTPSAKRYTSSSPGKEYFHNKTTLTTAGNTRTNTAMTSNSNLRLNPSRVCEVEAISIQATKSIVTSDVICIVFEVALLSKWVSCEVAARTPPLLFSFLPSWAVRAMDWMTRMLRDERAMLTRVRGTGSEKKNHVNETICSQKRDGLVALVTTQITW